MHEKGLQRQIGVGTLARSQERRALAVPRINRWTIAGFVTLSVYMGLRDMPCMRRVDRDKRAPAHWSAATNEQRPSSRGQTAYQPVVNRGSTERFVPPSVCIGFSLFVLPNER